LKRVERILEMERREAGLFDVKEKGNNGCFASVKVVLSSLWPLDIGKWHDGR